MDKSKQHSESGVEIARLRNELCNLKATLHDLTNQDEVAASLAAERALNRWGILYIIYQCCVVYVYMLMSSLAQYFSIFGLY